MYQTDSIDKLAAALTKAQAEIGTVAKTAENPFFKSKYADLAAVTDAIRVPFANHGLAVHQGYSVKDGHTYMVTRLIHSSGQWLEDDGVPLLLSKNDMQGLGSASTYARRYGLMAAAGVAPHDDDGNAASGKSRANGNGGVITADQKDELIALIKETGANTKALLTYYGAASIDELPADRFTDCKGALEKKKDKANGN